MAKIETNPLTRRIIELAKHHTGGEGLVIVILTESMKDVKHIFGSIAEKITSGEQRREAAAELAAEYGPGGQTFAAETLGMSRNTVRKGQWELENGEKIKDKFNLRGRKKTTEVLPELESQIKTILDSQSQSTQADPKFQTGRLYTKMTVGEVRKQLMEQYGYTEGDLPTRRTINTIVNDLKYTVKTVKKTEPLKKVPETELIFENLTRVHEAAAEDGDVVRVSMDAKDRVKAGCFSRGGVSRVEVKAYDHDFGDEYVTPFGIMDVKKKEADIYLTKTKVTADFMVDAPQDWWVSNGYANSGKKILLNMDNGPENSSHRTQFMKRLIEFSVDYGVEITLAYYPPYHSKYNPVERVWGVLEVHWGGELLDSAETIAKYIETATYDQKNLRSKIVGAVYETGVKVTKKAMKIYEKALERIAGLEDYFVRISPKRCAAVLPYNLCYC